MKNILVFKIGGSVLNTKKSREDLIFSLSSRFETGSAVLVHGGGNSISQWLNDLGIETAFIEGQRVTDEKSMQVVEMVLSGLVNKELVSILKKNGFKSSGMSGRDCNLAVAKIVDDRLGLVGQVEKVNPEIIYCMLEKGICPVLSPVCSDNEGAAVNVNADCFAAEIAGELKADAFNIVTDSGGVLQDNKMIESIETGQIESLINSGVVTVGMIPKLQSAAAALKAGVKAVNMLNYKGEIGTVIK